jgi:hypothetical protein
VTDRNGFANVGVVASAICAVHCAALPFVAGAAFFEHSAFHSPVMEGALIGVAAVVGYATLGSSYRHHRRPLPLVLLTSGLLLMFAAHTAIGAAGSMPLAVTGALLLVGAQILNRRCPAPCCAHLHD